MAMACEHQQFNAIRGNVVDVGVVHFDRFHSIVCRETSTTNPNQPENCRMKLLSSIITFAMPLRVLLDLRLFFVFVFSRFIPTNGMFSTRSASPPSHLSQSKYTISNRIPGLFTSPLLFPFSALYILKCITGIDVLSECSKSNYLLAR